MNIPSTPLALVVAASLALSGCDKLPLPGIKDAVSAAAGSTAALDQEVRGELTTSSPINYNDGSRHQLHSLRLDANQAVEVVLDGALRGTLSVLQGNQVVATSGHPGMMAMGEHDHGPSDNGPVRLVFRATEAGTYSLAVSGASAKAFGPYRFTARTIAAYDGKPLTSGNAATDWLINDTQSYPVQIDTAGLYALTAESSVFDTVLSLEGNGVNEENDDGGNGTNSRLQLWLEPGQYTAQVRSLGGNKGDFRLALASPSLEPGTVVRDGTALPLNQRITAITGQQGARSFTFQMPRGGRVVFDARSTDFDTLLDVSGNGVDASDDDGGNGTNSRLELQLAAGRYNVDVRSLGGQPGSFTLEASSSVASAASSVVPTAEEVAIPVE